MPLFPSFLGGGVVRYRENNRRLLEGASVYGVSSAILSVCGRGGYSRERGTVRRIVFSFTWELWGDRSLERLYLQILGDADSLRRFGNFLRWCGGGGRLGDATFFWWRLVSPAGFLVPK